RGPLSIAREPTVPPDPGRGLLSIARDPTVPPDPGRGLLSIARDPTVPPDPGRGLLSIARDPTVPPDPARGLLSIATGLNLLQSFFVACTRPRQLLTGTFVLAIVGASPGGSRLPAKHLAERRLYKGVSMKQRVRRALLYIGAGFVALFVFRLG